jgi:hypothetical protein
MAPEEGGGRELLALALTAEPPQSSPRPLQLWPGRPRDVLRGGRLDWDLRRTVERGVQDAAQRRGGPVRILERSRAPHVERVPGGVLVDGETVVPTSGGERGADGWLYSAHRGSILSVRRADKHRAGILTGFPKGARLRQQEVVKLRREGLSLPRLGGLARSRSGPRRTVAGMSERESAPDSNAMAWRADPWRLFALLPGVFAVGLAGLYAVGATLWVSEVNGADLDVGHVMPLIPLEQVLARGVGIVAVVGGLSLIVSPVAWFILRSQVVRGDGAERTRIDRTRGKHRAVVGLLFLVLMLLLALVAPLVVWLGVTLGFAAYYVAWWRGAIREVMPLARLMTYTAAIGLVIILAQTWFDPGDLSSVRVVTDSRVALQGKLLVNTGDTWYVVTDEPRVIGIPADQVIRSKIAAEEGERHSAFGRLCGCEVVPRLDDR